MFLVLKMNQKKISGNNFVSGGCQIVQSKRFAVTRQRFTGWNFAEAWIQIPVLSPGCKWTIRSSTYSPIVHAREFLVRVMV